MLLAFLALLAAPGSPSLAPLTSSDSYPTSKGTMGVSFALPSGGGSSVGLTYFVANDTAARVDFQLDAPFSPSGQIATFNLALALRLYQAKHDRVGVFIEPSIFFGRAGYALGTPAQYGAESLGFGGAVGVEYFFTDHFSAGGTLGVALVLANLGGPAGTSTATDLSTGTSSLFANIYF